MESGAGVTEYGVVPEFGGGRALRGEVLSTPTYAMNFMAKKSYKGPRMEPAVMRMSFDVDADVKYLDLSQCASILNRRFYKQGIQWAVARITFVDTTGLANGTVNVQKIPTTWVAANSWKKSEAAWDQMNEKAMEFAEGVKPRYYDYKIHMDQTHVASGFANNLLPVGITTATAGEWLASEFVIPDEGANTVQSFYVHMTGADNANGKGLVVGYERSRALPFDPDPRTFADLSENWISQVFNQGTLQTSEVLDDLEDTNDGLPYYDNYIGGATLDQNEIVDEVVFRGTAQRPAPGSRLSIGGFTAPCGLIRINQLAGATLRMYVDLVPGSHRGYLCEKMGDM